MHLVPIGGLCNRLRAIFSHLVVARAAGELLHVYWYKHSACPAHFYELFKPIMDPALIMHEMSPTDHPPSGFIQTCGVAAGVPEAAWPTDLLRPIDRIQRRIDELKRSLGPAYVAVHVRRTDHNKNYGDDLKIGDWITEALAEGTITEALAEGTIGAKEGAAYVAADNFVSIATLKKIHPAIIYNGRFSATGIRMTSIADAVVDLWICADAIAFRGTYYSSFSDWIEMMRQKRGLPVGDLSRQESP